MLLCRCPSMSSLMGNRELEKGVRDKLWSRRRTLEAVTMCDLWASDGWHGRAGGPRAVQVSNKSTDMCVVLPS